MTAPRRYALWLLLPDEPRARLVTTIERLASEHGTPPFEPHITLLGSIGGAEHELVRCARELAQRLTPFETRLGEIACLNEHYRSVFVRVPLTPALADARAAAQTAFAGPAAEAPFMPHVSLLYGERPMATKETIVANLGESLATTLRIERLALQAVDGPPQSWRRVASFALGRN